MLIVVNYYIICVIIIIVAIKIKNIFYSLQQLNVGLNVSQVHLNRLRYVSLKYTLLRYMVL